jgi:hypothetical protein
VPFVNMVLNDAIFLLDESMSKLAKIKQMTEERQNKVWDRLPEVWLLNVLVITIKKLLMKTITR